MAPLRREREPRRFAIELWAKIAEVASQDDPRNRREQMTVSLRHSIGTQQEDSAGPVEPAAPPRFTNQGGQLLLHFIEVVGRMIVDDD